MNDKENVKKDEQEPTSQTSQLRKQPPRYNKNEEPKIHRSETQPRPKKQRQQKRER